MRFIFLLFLLCAITSCTKRIPLHPEWEKKIYKKANTAKFAFYLSRRSKESIRTMNLMRMNPALFARTYYLDYLVRKELISGNSDTISMFKSAHGSLYSELIRTKPLPRMKPSFALHLSSAFHAITSGISGYTGHDRPMPFSFRLKLFGTFNGNIGENCDYGEHDPFGAIMDLAIDEGVSGYGHRRNLMSKNFIRVGCSFKFHRKYGWNYVQDFSSGNLFERKRKRKVVSRY